MADHQPPQPAPSPAGLRGEPVSEGRLVTVFAAKGGCGKTTIATNLAVALRQAGQRRVCLVDLDLGFGDLAPLLGLTDQRSLGDWKLDRHANPADAVAEVITNYAPGLDCVLSPTTPGVAVRITPQAVEGLLHTLTLFYDTVVIDTPSRFTQHVLAALDCSHEHVLIATPERPALRNLRLALDAMDLLGYPADSRSVVFNRSDTGAAITAADVERAVRVPVAAHVPSSRDVQTSINGGRPLLLDNPRHPVSRAIDDFAQRSLRRWQAGQAPIIRGRGP